jgi:hypothetical protein
MFGRRHKPEVIHRINVVNLRPNDILVLESEKKLPRDIILKIQRQMQERFPSNQVVFLDGGVKLTTALRKDSA